VAVAMSEGSEILDHHMEEAQKTTPVLPHFQYTRVNFKLHIIRTLLFVYREVYKQNKHYTLLEFNKFKFLCFFNLLYSSGSQTLLRTVSQGISDNFFVYRIVHLTVLLLG
jgi:hypothetical protein